MTTTQAPLRSGFSAQTTAREAVGDARLDGRTAIVTGGYAGIGLETTRALVNAGATVIVPARTPDKARAALAGLARVELEALDLAAPSSIDAFAERFVASGRPLHILVNNAGVMATPFLRDARGFESQLATNHLGHFQLAARLWPALRAARGARVVALSSRGHARAGVDFDDPHFERRPYDKWVAYGQAKTANALFAVALDARGAAHDVRAFSVHPGAVMTELVRSISQEELAAIRARLAESPYAAATFYKNTEQGAATSVWCATSPQLDGKGGVYCEDVDIAEAVPNDFPEPRGVRQWARDPGFAERLWKMSEEWTGAAFAA
ncbi:MAG TPA: oxidoreductase [Polyangia bacterium]|jgi:NAD(P)-dependent dehydrogenase (short-subunit alcohol dehydrogenase family)|nr:oxidoreductase [Polyangia bacterium]